MTFSPESPPPTLASSSHQQHHQQQKDETTTTTRFNTMSQNSKKQHNSQQQQQQSLQEKQRKKRKKEPMSYTQRKQVKRRQRALQHTYEAPQPFSSSFDILNFSSFTTAATATNTSQVCTTLFLLCILSMLYRRSSMLPLTSATTTTTTTTTTSSKEKEWKVPFFYIPHSSSSSSSTSSSSPPFEELSKALSTHSQNIQVFITTLLKQEEMARKSEWMLFPQTKQPQLLLFPQKIKEKIGHIVEILEEDLKVLESILKEFDCVMGLPAPQSPPNIDSTSKMDKMKNSAHNNQKASSSSKSKNKVYTSQQSKQTEEHRASLTYPPPPPKSTTPSSYDSLNQVITHLTRDYTAAGASIRSSLYSWCIQTLHEHASHPNGGGRVLIPGAGLGRLGLEMISEGYDVEMNEISLIMASAAHYFLHFKPEQQQEGKIHPFAFDLFLNEVDSSYRCDEVVFPDEGYQNKKRGMLYPSSTTNHHHHRRWWWWWWRKRQTKRVGTASYTIGDFISIYSSSVHKSSFDYIVTCFFIDTATNIYEYLLLISHVLKEDGLWINVGPLQWHANALLTPSANELHSLIEDGFGFEILEWSVDDVAVNYRHEEDNSAGEGKKKARYTKMTESYYPLRFVARKKKKVDGVLNSNGLLEEEDEDVWKVICQMRESIGGGGQKMEEQEDNQDGDTIHLNSDEYGDNNDDSHDDDDDSTGEKWKSTSSSSKSSVVIEEL